MNTTRKLIILVPDQTKLRIDRAHLSVYHRDELGVLKLFEIEKDCAIEFVRMAAARISVSVDSAVGYLAQLYGGDVPPLACLLSYQHSATPSLCLCGSMVGGQGTRKKNTSGFYTVHARLEAETRYEYMNGRHFMVANSNEVSDVVPE